MGGSWSIEAAHPLHGGITGIVAAVDLRNSTGKRRRLVLKLYRPEPQEPDSAWREAHVLQLLGQSELPVPRVVAIDRDGSETEWPALLMVRMPGRRRMQPKDPMPWLLGLASLARGIHEEPIQPQLLPSYRPWGLDGSLLQPPWWTDGDVWQRAVEIVRSPAPAEPKTFIHRDYYAGNVLWSGARASAIVDWLHGCWGPASVDVAHCRLNLWLDHGPHFADVWLDAYKQIRPAAEPHHPYWDLVDAMGWVIDPACHGWRRARRHQEFVSAAVARLTSQAQT
ncbi:MAG: phosphotransferase family protein [Candidatus Dormibacterales bacterium]